MSFVLDPVDLGVIEDLGSGASARLVCDHPTPGPWTVVPVPNINRGVVTFFADQSVHTTGFELYEGIDLRYAFVGPTVRLLSGDNLTVSWNTEAPCSPGWRRTL